MSDAEVQKYLGVSNTFNTDVFASWVDEAKQEHLYPALSKEQTEEILNGTSATTYSVEIIDQTKRALCHFAYAMYLPTHILQISNLGVTEHTSPDQRTAKPENVENLRKSLLDIANANIRRILDEFEKNPEGYSLWKASDSYSIFEELLLPTTTAFGRYVNIRNSRRVFLLLVPSIRLVQEVIFGERIGADVLADMIASSEVKPKYVLETYLKPALARLAIADALPNMSVVLGKYETVLWFDDSSNNYAKSYKNVPPSVIQMLVDLYKKQGEELLCKATAYISENAEAFPKYPVVTPIISTETAANCDTQDTYNRVVGF